MEELLPTKPRKAIPNPLSLTYLAIGVPKWGKTTFFCDAPDALLIAFERGFQFQQCPTVFIEKWLDSKFEPYTDDDGIVHMTMGQLRKSLMASDKYKFLIFDTADMAAKKCSDYHLQKHNWQHAQDGGDFGRGYDIVQNTPFRQLVGDLMGTGRGIAFITHQQVNSTDMQKGKKAMKETTLPGGVYKFLHTQADIIMHASFGSKRPGNKYRDRIWQTEGDEETLAGSRCRDLYLPSRYVVDPERPWAEWAEFFTNPDLAAEADLGLVGSKAKPEEGDDETPKKKLSVKKRQ